MRQPPASLHFKLNNEFLHKYIYILESFKTFKGFHIMRKGAGFSLVFFMILSLRVDATVVDFIQCSKDASSCVQNRSSIKSDLIYKTGILCF